jgi:cytochrome b6-f complex iron-sulfur subunit
MTVREDTDMQSPELDAREGQPGQRPAGCSRRALLQCGAAVCALPALVPLAGCAPRIDLPTAIALDAPVDDIATVALSRVPELLAPGGSLILHPEGLDADGRPISVLVVNSTTQGLLAWDAYCPHAGCEVAWDDGPSEVVCPCHLSRFAVDGTVKNPPAQENLRAYPVKLQRSNQVLSVDLNGSGDLFPAAVSGVVSFTLAQLPALATVGGSVTSYSRGVVHPLLVFRTGANTIEAFDARCPHLGCSVYGAGQVLICKCHGSLFGLDGSVKLGPATQPLKEFAVAFDGTNVAVTVG